MAKKKKKKKGAILVQGTGNGNVVEAAAGGLGVKVTGLTLQLGRWVSTSRFPDFALNFAASASAVGGFQCVIPCSVLALFGRLEPTDAWRRGVGGLGVGGGGGRR